MSCFFHFWLHSKPALYPISAVFPFLSEAKQEWPLATRKRQQKAWCGQPFCLQYNCILPAPILCRSLEQSHLWVVMSITLGHAMKRILFNIFVSPLIPSFTPKSREEFQVGAG